MKEIGPCVVIVEPMIFEAVIYFSREPAIVASANAPVVQQPVQYATQNGGVAASSYGTPYRSQSNGQQALHQPQTLQHQAGALPSVSQQVQHVAGANNALGRTLPLINQANTSQNGIAAHSVGAPTAPMSSKPQPDPVIQMLATRASTDRDLKDLMKVVATGTADQEQLKRFQKHIDELNIVIQAQKAQAQAAQQSAVSTSQSASPAPMMSHPSSGPSRTATPQMQPPPAQPRPIAQPPQKRSQVIPNYPVVIEFQGAGASQDRFLFPPYSIVEPLGSFSILASFLIFRKGGEAADPTLFEADTEYFEPITVKIDVTPKHTEVLEYMKRSVKPQEEVRKWMEEKLQTCKRAPIRSLPLRLPHQSQIVETDETEGEPTMIETKKSKGGVKKEKMAEPTAESPKPEEVPQTGPGRRRSKKVVRIGDTMEL